MPNDPLDTKQVISGTLFPDNLLARTENCSIWIAITNNNYVMRSNVEKFSQDISNAYIITINIFAVHQI